MANDGMREVTEKAKEIGEVTVKLSLDVSDALTSIKAVERKAREAKRAVAELNGNTSIYLDAEKTDLEKVASVLSEGLSKMSLRAHGGESIATFISDFSTADLVAELARREGVEYELIKPGYCGSIKDYAGPGRIIWVPIGKVAE